MSDREHEEVVEVERTDDEPLLGLKGSQTTSDREHKEVMEDKLSDEKLSKLERGRKKVCFISFKEDQLTDEQMSELQRGGEIACYITVVEDKQSDEELSKLFRARVIVICVFVLLCLLAMILMLYV